MALTKVSRGLLSTSIVDNGNATAITIDSSENVGIGVSPATKLDVASTGEVVSTVRTTSTSGARQATLRLNVPSTGGDDPAGRVQFTYGTGYTVAGSIEMSHTNNNMKFLTGTTERMRIDASGNVGIGGTSTGYKVHVFGNESMIRMQNTGSGTNGFLDLAVSSTVATINANYSTSAIPLRFLTGAAERMRIDASGRVTMPSQPAFLVKPSSSQTIPVGANTTVLLGTEVFDQGGNFASNTFTAPVTGRYQFDAAIYCLNVDSATQYVELVLKTSNRFYYYIFSTNALSQDAAYMSFPISVLVDMDADDTASLQFQLPNSGTAQMDVNPVSSFSGYLVA